MKNLYTSPAPATATAKHSNFYSSFMRLPALRVLLILMMMVGVGNVGWGQQFQQDFSSSTTVSDYVNASPTNGQFDAISSTGVGVAWSINTGKLRMAWTGSQNGAATRTTDFSGIPNSLMIKFDLQISNNSANVTSAIAFQIGSGFTTSNSAEITANIHSRFAINTTTTAGQFVIRRNESTAANSANLVGSQAILWVINNSGSSLTYLAPDGTYENVGNDTWDIWAGTTKIFNDIAAFSTLLSITDFKIATNAAATVNIDIDNILIDPIPAKPTSNAASLINSTDFTANWTSVAGATGYRLDVATDAGFTTFVSGFNNLYVSGQASSSKQVIGLTASTPYWYRVRAAAQYTVGEFAGENSASQNPTTASGGGLTPPTLTADATLNDVDHNIDIQFTDDATWRGLVTAVKIGGTTLTVTTDYVLSAGNLQLLPSGGNTLLRTPGSKAVTIEATGYTVASVTQVINAGAPTSNSTVSINLALAPNTTRTITCTAKDQYNNLVSGYTFKYDAAVTNNDVTTAESYTIDGTATTSSSNDINVVATTDGSGLAAFTAVLPATIDPSDGISLQVQLSDGSTNIGTAFSFTQLQSQTITFATLTPVTYGDAPFTVSATGGGSGNPVTFTSSDPTTATCTGINGTTVTIVKPGTFTIYANQAGNGTYNAALQVDQSLLINVKALTLPDAAAQNKIYTGTNEAVITGTLTGIVGSDVVTLNGTGTFSSVDVADNIAVTSTSTLGGANLSNYTLTLPTGLKANITPASQTITFGALPIKTIGDADFAPGATSATSGTNPITYTSDNTGVATIVSGQIHIVGAGTSIITASQTASLNYSAASDVPQTLTVYPLPIAAWDFTGVGSTSLPTFAATTFSSDLISVSGASDVTRGATAAWSGAGNSFRTVGFKNEGIATTNTDYFEITLQPPSGKTLSLSTIDANLNGTGTFCASPGVTSQFAYSLDGTNFVLIGSPQTTIGGPVSLPQVDLSGISTLQNVNFGTIVTLRYYASGQTTTGGWGFYSSASGVNGLAIGGEVLCATPAIATTTLIQPTCAITTGTITVTAPTGTGMTYSIDGTTYTNTNGIFSGLTPNTYSVTAKNACGNISALASVTIDALPALPTTPTATITSPDCGETTGSITINTQTGVKYSIDGINYFVSNVFTGVASGSYTIYVQSTSAGNCVASTVGQVVNAAPAVPTTPTATIASPVCGETTGSITIAAQTDVEYSIDGTNYFANNVFAGVTPNTYTIYVKSTFTGNCASSTGGQVVNAAPIIPDMPTISAGGPIPFCEGGSVNLTSSIGSGYLWSTGATTQSINVTTAGSYTVKVTNGSGCESSSSLPTDVTVDALPATPTISAGGPITFCAGANVTLTSSAGSSYLWSTAETTASIVVSSTGSYTVKVTDAAGCESAPSVGTTVTVNAFPTVNAGTDDATTTNIAYPLTGTASNFTGQVTWTSVNNSGPVATITNPNSLWTDATPPTFSSTGSGSYTVTLTATNSGCTKSDDVLIFVLDPQDPQTWQGGATGHLDEWGYFGNWSPAGVPGATTDVTIPAARTYYPVIYSTATCRNITIESGASIMDNGYLTVTGTSTIKRDMTALKWHDIALPNNSTTAYKFLGDYLKTWDEELVKWTYITNDIALIPVQGYRLWTTTAKTYTFTGTFNTGTMTPFPIVYHANALYDNDGANLLGNPYPSYLDWATLRLDYGAVYYWNGTAYTVWNNNGDVNARYVPPMQGFFIVKDVSMSATTFNLTNANRVNRPGGNYYKSSSGINSNSLVLQTLGETYSDKLYIAFNPATTEEFDFQNDAYKFLGKTKGVSEIYSYTSKDKLAIDVRPETAVIPLGFTNTESGEYQIGIQDIADIPLVYLEDLKTNTFNDLTAGPYNFSYVAGENDKRFLLHFGTTSVKEDTKAPASIYSYQQTVYINMKDQVKGDVFVYNMAGQQVAFKKSVQGIGEIKLRNVGNYVVKVVTKDKTVVRKVFIQQL